MSWYVVSSVVSLCFQFPENNNFCGCENFSKTERFEVELLLFAL
jgi:hypothetical protein